MMPADEHELAKARAACMANPITPAMKLATVVTTFQKWLHLPDPTALLGVLGTVAANLLPGDPVWLLIVGPPGGGKTELLQPLAGLPNVHMTSTLTEASLLSATPTRDKARDASGGLLRNVGKFGTLLCKDFTSVLSMNRDGRACVLAALREISDGSWTRHVGVDGGRTLHWEGKLGLIGACTSVIDQHHSVISAMGERFVMFRLPAIDEEILAKRALGHEGRETEMRAELARAVRGLFVDLSLTGVPMLDDTERNRLIALATLTVRSRSAVERDGHTREVELIPESEAPGRLALALSRLLAGITVIGALRADAWRVVAKVSLDCIPALRLRVIQMLAGTESAVETITVATAVRYPTQTARRALEDLTAHGVVRRVSGGRGRADTWRLSDWAQKRLTDADITFPETSEEDNSDPFPEMLEGM
jgi:hypothetical protein